MDEQGAKAHDSSSSLRTKDQQRIVDQGLIDKTQTSERPAADIAFEELITPHEGRLHRRLVVRVAPDVTQADVLLNEIRWRAWCRLRRSDALTLRPPATFANYLYRIASNVIIEYHKRHSGPLGALSLEYLREQHPGWDAASGDWTDGTDEEALWRLQDDLLAGATSSAAPSANAPRQRPPRQRGAPPQSELARDGRSLAHQALEWVWGNCRDSYFLDKLGIFSHEQIGQILKVPTNTVSSHVRIAHEQFRALLALLLWEEEGANPTQIARELRVPINQVESHVERGRYLRVQREKHAGEMEDR